MKLIERPPTEKKRVRVVIYDLPSGKSRCVTLAQTSAKEVASLLRQHANTEPQAIGAPRKPRK